MTNTQDLYQLLRSREGQWVSRADLNFVGGLDTGRRMRELRQQIGRGGVERLDERPGPDRALEYRLVNLSSAEKQQNLERFNWVCAKCESYPLSMSVLQPSIDPRWRIGPCGKCGKGATFKQVVR